MTDNVNKPAHYRSHPSGIECIQITEHMGFNIGNAVKYLWRCDLKADAIEDLEKAEWYIRREIDKRKAAAATDSAQDALSGFPGYVGPVTALDAISGQKSGVRNA